MAPLSRPASATQPAPVTHAAPTAPPAIAVSQGAGASLVPMTSGPAPLPAPAATATAEPLASLVVAAEQALRTGQFEAVMTYDGGSRSDARLLFDLGDTSRPPRLQMTSTYTGPAGSQVIERIVVGEREWERRDASRWAAVPPRDSVWHQVQVLLPNAARAHDPEVAHAGEAAVLRWPDTGYDTDVTLQVDPASGVPRSLQRTTRSTGAVMRITYSGWNTPTEINPPEPA
jgi:hypothetical protein